MRMKTAKVLFTTSLLLACVSAPVVAQVPDWNYLQVSYIESEFDEPVSRYADVSEPDGFEVAGSFAIGENLFVDVSYSKQEAEEAKRFWSNSDVFLGLPDIKAEFERIGAGVGYRWQLVEGTDLYGRLGYEDWSLDLSSSTYRLYETGEIDDNGVTVVVGVRSVLWRFLELRGQVGYNDVVEEPSAELAAHFIIADRFVLGVSYEKIDDLEIRRATARYQF